MATPKLSPSSWAVIIIAMATTFGPPAKGIRKALAAETAALRMMAGPKPAHRVRAGKSSAPPSAPTPPMAMVTPSKAGEKPRVRMAKIT